VPTTPPKSNATLYFSPRFSRLAAHPDLQAIQSALMGHDWPKLAEFFNGLPDQNTRSVAYRILADVRGKGTDEFLAKAAQSETGSTVARTFYATTLIYRGWEVRGAKWAKGVSSAQFASLHDYMRRAEGVLREAVADDPGNASAWTGLLDTARGLQMSQVEARRRYEQAIIADPNHFRAQGLLLQKLAPKWGGNSWDEMHAFATECLQSCPNGALGAVQVVDGHLERWLGLKRGWSASRYLRKAHVREEIHLAAERSVLHKSFTKTYGWVPVHSSFAMAFSLIGDYQAAAVHFRALGTYANRVPWLYLGNPATTFVKHRTRALQKAQ